ncbi:hypothetical protein [Halomarina litorea]|uniref:hypothetical protein n=1 Tax=Halomarina litorea TaxID=2961595 RepID=UPI0020C30CF4|nr:hypothetical protein [Halomarina sp. BCD28]
MSGRLTEAEARRLLALGRDLGPAAPNSDIVDMLAVGTGVKPMAGLAACYTAEGIPAWDVVEPEPTLAREDLGRALDAVGFDWVMTPVETVEEDGREFIWYELLLGTDRQTVPRFLRTAGPSPGARTQRQYGEALGYPSSAVEWFVDRTPEADHDTVFEVIADSDAYGDNAQTLAASVPYVPSPTREGAKDAISDGRELTNALGSLDDVADRDAYAETLLGERVRETFSNYDAAQAWRDPLHRAMG